ncbi:MAG TPA: shikimate dehydrogenase [Gammaproteobacteria bacterium]|nr:shikimate dehydrogenase [Gammaproteobacteria bacterium]
MDKYAVIGSPISHSLSPKIHAAFAQQTGQELEYTAIEIKPEEFFDRLNELQNAGYRGLNVTLPLKGLAWEAADTCSADCNRAQAVNVLALNSDGSRHGFNTDGSGLLRDLTVTNGIRLEGRRILIVGAGGAVRGILAPLLRSGPLRITVANRTADKALELAESFSDLGEIEGCGLDGIAPKHSAQLYDLVINGTAAGIDNSLPALPDDILAPGAVTYDLMYARQPTAFVKWGRDHGARLALDGLGMLVEQAAESFYIWRTVKPDPRPVLAMLRA